MPQTSSSAPKKLYPGQKKDTGRAFAALEIADYIIKGTMIEDVSEIPGEDYYRETLDILRDYLHKFDLSSLSEEIRHAYGSDARTMPKQRLRRHDDASAVFCITKTTR